MNKWFNYTKRAALSVIEFLLFSFRCLQGKAILPSPRGTILVNRNLERKINIALTVLSPVVIIMAVIYAMVSLITISVAAVVGTFALLQVAIKHVSNRRSNVDTHIHSSHATLTQVFNASTEVKAARVVTVHDAAPSVSKISSHEVTTSAEESEEILSQEYDTSLDVDVSGDSEELESISLCSIQ